MPGKGFSSQIKKMSKKPLKYNPEVVTVVKVDMAQDMFDFAMDTVARIRRSVLPSQLHLPSIANHNCRTVSSKIQERR